MPGGIVIGAESQEDAFARQVFEETGLVISGIELVRIVSGYRIRMEIYFRARLDVEKGVQTLNLQYQKIFEVRFFSFYELPENMLPLQKEVTQRVGVV